MSKFILWSVLLTVSAVGTMMAIPPNLEKVLQAQEALAREQPGNADVINDLGNLLGLAGRLDEAEDAYRRAVELTPERAIPHYNLGLLLQRKGKPGEALEHFLSVLELDAGHAWAHYQVGAIYEAQGVKEKAVRSYARAFTLNHDLTRPSVNPQVIDNQLVVEATLKAYRDLAVRPLAPRSYDDPDRIASLMIDSSSLMGTLPSEPSPDSEALSEGEIEEPSAPSSTGSRASWQPATDEPVLEVFGEDASESAPEPEASAKAGDAAGVRILSRQTIESGAGSRNQVKGGSTAGRGGARGSRQPSRTYLAPGEDRPSIRYRPGGSTQPRYRPSIRSTGSLVPELIPTRSEPTLSAAR